MTDIPGAGGAPYVPPPRDHPLDERLARRRHAAVAGHRGDPAVARALLDDPDPGVRASAMGALHRLGALTGGELARAAADTVPLVRRRAAEILAAGTDPDPDPGTGPARGSGDGGDNLLVALLHDPEPAVVETAAWAAGERFGAGGDSEVAGGDSFGLADGGLGNRTAARDAAVERLVALATGHPDPLCRESAVAALGAIGDERGLAAILSATRDRATVRRRAVLALAPFEGPEVDAALEAARTDRDWQVRQAAEDLLAD